MGGCQSVPVPAAGRGKAESSIRVVFLDLCEKLGQRKINWRTRHLEPSLRTQFPSLQSHPERVAGSTTQMFGRRIRGSCSTWHPPEMAVFGRKDLDGDQLGLGETLLDGHVAREDTHIGNADLGGGDLRSLFLNRPDGHSFSCV